MTQGLKREARKHSQLTFISLERSERMHEGYAESALWQSIRHTMPCFLHFLSPGFMLRCPAYFALKAYSGRLA